MQCLRKGVRSFKDGMNGKDDMDKQSGEDLKDNGKKAE